MALNRVKSAGNVPSGQHVTVTALLGAAIQWSNLPIWRLLHLIVAS